MQFLKVDRKFAPFILDKSFNSSWELLYGWVRLNCFPAMLLYTSVKNDLAITQQNTAAILTPHCMKTKTSCFCTLDFVEVKHGLPLNNQKLKRCTMSYEIRNPTICWATGAKEKSQIIWKEQESITSKVLLCMFFPTTTDDFMILYVDGRVTASFNFITICLACAKTTDFKQSIIHKNCNKIATKQSSHLPIVDSLSSFYRIWLFVAFPQTHAVLGRKYCFSKYLCQ